MQTEILNLIIEEVKKGRRAALALITESKGSVPGAHDSIMAVLEDGSTLGTIGGGAVEYEVIKEALKAIKNGKDASFDHNLTKNSELKMLCGGKNKGYIKVFKPNPQLIIFGGGHVGQKLARIAQKTNFDVTVVDNRKEYQNKEDLKEVDKFVGLEVEDAIKELSFNKDNTYIVVCTADSDLRVLEAVLEKDYKFIGMIGSRHKVKTISQSLKEKGFKDELFERVRVPLGLDIDDGSVEEMAISILSEILSVKNDKTLK